MLVDVGQLPPLPVEVQEWLHTHCLPVLQAMAPAQLAILLPQDVYSSFMVEHLVLNPALVGRADLDIQFFTASDYDMALEWLTFGLLIARAPVFSSMASTGAWVRSPFYWVA
ncbi:hypothetical protein [Hymenobacter canadensis]|uniref:Uncharacterized protein n=1 Tax=Hymenobacter canadensis TaxID=2999067 RepID=A0ABY7LYT0_9BACT|nr:hypothetical protein [Hymenobacter canadensis]WBA44108.1 hypothetical protein O3303_19660 [Hymenobacter canadensis]